MPTPKPDIAIKCSKCGRKAVEVCASTKSYFDPKFYCKCGFKGELQWNAPTPKKS